MNKFIYFLVILGFGVILSIFIFLGMDRIGQPSETYELTVVDKQYWMDEDGGSHYKVIFDFPDQGNTVEASVYRDTYYSIDIGEKRNVDVSLGRYSQAPYVTSVP